MFRNATLQMDDGERIIVALKDVSASGAGVEFFCRIALPDTFLLIEPMLKLRRRARLVWQNHGVAGVAFID